LRDKATLNPALRASAAVDAPTAATFSQASCDTEIPNARRALDERVYRVGRGQDEPIVAWRTGGRAASSGVKLAGG